MKEGKDEKNKLFNSKFFTDGQRGIWIPRLKRSNIHKADYLETKKKLKTWNNFFETSNSSLNQLIFNKRNTRNQRIRLQSQNSVKISSQNYPFQ